MLRSSASFTNAEGEEMRKGHKKEKKQGWTEVDSKREKKKKKDGKKEVKGTPKKEDKGTPKIPKSASSPSSQKVYPEHSSFGFLGVSRPALEDSDSDGETRFKAASNTVDEFSSGDEGAPTEGKFPAEGAPLLSKSSSQPVSSGSGNAGPAPLPQQTAPLNVQNVRTINMPEEYNDFEGVVQSGSSNDANPNPQQDPELHAEFETAYQSALQLLLDLAKEGKNFKTGYKVGKYSLLVLTVALSLILYYKTALEISQCDLDMKNAACDMETGIRALIGSLVANSIVGVNTYIQGADNIERNIPPKGAEDLFKGKKSKAERAKLVGIICAAAGAAVPPTTALFTTAAQWRKPLSIFEAVATWASNSVMDVFPTQIILGMWLAVAGVAILMPIPSIAILLGVGAYKLWQKYYLTEEQRRKNSLINLRDTYVAKQKEEYLEKLAGFSSQLSNQAFEWTRWGTALKPEVLQEFKNSRLTPQQINNFLEKSKEGKKNRSCGATVYSGVRGVLQFGGLVFTNLGLSGYYYSVLSGMAAVMFPLYTNPALVLSNLSWWQYAALVHVEAIPLGVFTATVNYFGWQAFGYIVDFVTGHWDSLPGFKIYPKTAALLTVAGGYFCYDSRYTAVFLVDQFIEAVKLWSRTSGNRSAVDAFTSILKGSAEYVAPTNNLASWITTMDSVLMAAAKSGIALDGGDERLFASVLSQVGAYADSVKSMDLKPFAEDPNINITWIEDDELLNRADDAERIYSPKADAEGDNLFARENKPGLFSSCCTGRRVKATNEASEVTHLVPTTNGEEDAVGDYKGYRPGLGGGLV